MNRVSCCSCFALLLVAAGCSQQSPADTRAADESAVKDTDAQWAKTAMANDLDGTVAYYSDDASILPPNSPIVAGKTAIRTFWTALLSPHATLSWETTKVEAARSGDMAYVMGVYTITPKDAEGKSMTDRGKLVEVWKKQADGKWKTVADIFNSDLPLPAPVEAKK